MAVNMKNIKDIAENNLCCGCGVCAYLNPDQISMVDDIEAGRRPLVQGDCSSNSQPMNDAVKACPGINLNYTYAKEDPNLIAELLTDWGPVRSMTEGFAAEESIRFGGSSGGAATALALFCMEKLGMHGLLHIDARGDIPYLNETRLSTSREQVTSAMGSRYAPASPCDGLQKIVDADGPCVIIGKPCDIAAVQQARKLRPELDKNIGLTIAIFCAATPSTAATIDLLKHLGADDIDMVKGVRYRGNGWPGNAKVSYESDGEVKSNEMTYADSWGKILSPKRQWRCNICIDHTGEFADISVGDPWYREVKEDDVGRSLIMARTELGEKIVKAAEEQVYLTHEQVEPWVLPASQNNLLNVRSFAFGRLLGLRLLGAPVPTITGVNLFSLWLKRLSLVDKVKTVLGTMRRVYRYKLHKKRPVIPFETTKL